jgi:hypothetical protein
MNEKTTPETATTAAVPNIDKSKASATPSVQALKTDTADKPVVTPAPKS